MASRGAPGRVGGARPRPLALAVAAASLAVPRARAALSVLPHQSDGIVLQLRSAIVLDERDLDGPSPATACSSLDDGPFCAPFGRRPQGSGARGAAGAFPEWDFQAGSSHFVVDSLPSNRMQARNKKAFDWSADVYRSFSSLVSRLVGETASRVEDATSARSLSTFAQSSLARSGSQCFVFKFDAVPPHLATLPGDFAAGVPRALAPRWGGHWEVAALPRRGAQRGTPLLMRSSVGSLRLRHPVVVNRVALRIPAADLDDDLPWGTNGLVCGRLGGKEKWCAALDRAAASAREASAERGAGGPEEPFVELDIGDSFYAVDELAFVRAPEDKLQVVSIHVTTTLPAHPLYNATRPLRQVVLLRRPRRDRGVRPVLTSVSRDAAVWNVNEVLINDMTLRSVGGSAGLDGLEAETGIGKLRMPRGFGRPRRPPQYALEELAKRHAVEEAAAPPTLADFQEMLRELKSRRFQPPPGVPLTQLRREVGIFVKATKELEDTDVLQHSKVDSVIQQRLRAKSLDGLLALQASWRRELYRRQRSDFEEHLVDAESEQAAIDALELQGGMDEEVLEPEAMTTADELEDGEDVMDPPDADAEEEPETWEEEASQALRAFAQRLAQRRSSARQAGKGGDGQVEMDLDAGSIRLHVSDEVKVLKGLLTVLNAVGSPDAPRAGAGAAGSAAEGDGPDEEPRLAQSKTSGMKVRLVKLDDLKAGDSVEDADFGDMLTALLKQAATDVGTDDPEDVASTLASVLAGAEARRRGEGGGHDGEEVEA